jgi:hypothetical protein
LSEWCRVLTPAILFEESPTRYESFIPFISFLLSTALYVLL